MAKDLMLTVGADTASFQANMKKAADSCKGIQDAISVIKLDALVNLGRQAMSTVTQFYDMGRAVASVGNEIERQSRIVGMGVEAYQRWAYAAKMSDVDAEGLMTGLKRLSVHMDESAQGTGKSYQAFQAMGLSVTDANGKLKPLDEMMAEIAGKFSTWTDGPAKIALAMTLFGRSGEAIIPMLNRGRSGIQGLMDEAEKLNIVLGKDSITALKEAEDSYKRWEAVWKVSKAETFAPMLTIFTSILERITAMKSAFKEGGFTGLFQDILAAQEKQRIDVLGSAAWTKEWVAGWKPPTMGAAPVPKDMEKYYKDQKDYYNSLSKNAEMLEKTANPQFEAFWETLKGMDVDLVKLNRDSETWFATVQENMAEFHYEAPVEGAWTEMGLSKAEFDYFQKTAKEATEARSEWAATYSELHADTMGWIDMGKNITDSFGNAFQGVIAGTEKLSDAFKKMGQDIINIMIQALEKFVLFGNLTGKEGGVSFGTSGGGYGGIFGAVIGGIGSIFKPGGGGGLTGGFQHGGIITKPTLSMIGEAGPEAVIPLHGGKVPIEGGGDTYITNTFIEAIDAGSFEKKYGGVIDSINFKSKRFNRMANR